MRLLFRQSCKCQLKSHELPKPSIKTVRVPDMHDPIPEGELTIELSCARCGSPWIGSPVSALKIGGGK